MSRNRRGIVVVSRSTQIWGAEASLLTLATAMRDAGWEVRLLSRSPELAEQWPGPARVCGNRALMVRAVLAGLLLRAPWALVCGSLELAPVFGLLRLVPSRFRAGLVLDLHDYLQSERGRSRVRLTARCYDRVIAVSTFAASQLPVGKVRPLILPRPIASAASSAPPAVPAAAQPFRVGIVGRIDADKGIELALDAVAMTSGVQLVIRGSSMADPTYERDLVAKATALLGERVRFDGRVPLAEVMAGLDCLVVANGMEALGRTVAEAQLAGVPVLVPDQGGAQEMVEHERTGLVYAAGDAAGLAAAVTRLQGSAGLGRELAATAATTARERHDPAALAARFALYATTGTSSARPGRVPFTDGGRGRILFLSWYPPSRPDAGERVRINALADAFGRSNDVVVLSFSDDREPDAASPVADHRSAVVVPYAYTAAMKIRAVLQRKSVHEVVLTGSEARRVVRRTLAVHDPHVVIANQLPGWPLIPRSWRSRTVVDTHNAEGLRLARMVEAASALSKPLLRQQLTAGISLERSISRSAAAVWGVSPEDTTYFDGLGANGVIVPNGVTVPGVVWNRTRPPAEPLRLVFVGSLQYRANIDGLRWFKESWMQAGDAAEGGWTLDVIGSGDSTAVREIFAGVPGVTVVGRIEEIADAYLGHDALIVPLQLGGGSRLKVLEALGHGLPIIGSRVGVEGIGLVPGQHYLAAEGREDFVSAVKQLRADPEVGLRLSRSGRAVAEGMQWTAIAAAAEQTMQPLLHP